MTVQTYRVPDISCDHCKQSIEGAVAALPDVQRVSVDVAAKTVRVEGNATATDVRATIEAAGYDIEADN